MKEFGVEPIVVTRQWSNKHGNALDYISASESKETLFEQTEYGTIIRAPYFPSISNRILLKYGEQKFTFLRRALTAWDEFRQFITISGPKKHLYHAANDYLKHNKVDAIIATGDPFVTFYFAKKLGAKYNAPWIADYRDPWSQNIKKHNSIYKFWINKLEKKIVSKSILITTIPSINSVINKLFSNKKIISISNGYDNEIIDSVSTIPQQTNILTLTFVGTLYDWHPWKAFLLTLSTIIDSKGTKIQLNLYGVNKSEEIIAYLDKFNPKLKAAVSIFPRIPNSDLLSRIAKENVMLLFNYYHFNGTKIYDYLGLKRQILFCFDNDKDALKLKQKYFDTDECENKNERPQRDIIMKHNAGIIVKDQQHLYKVLENLIEEFDLNGKIECNSDNVEIYSRKLQASELSNLIKSL